MDIFIKLSFDKYYQINVIITYAFNILASQITHKIQLISFSFVQIYFFINVIKSLLYQFTRYKPKTLKSEVCETLRCLA